MKGLFKFVLFCIALLATADSYAQNFTNKGKEFWVAYGHHQFMENRCDGTPDTTNNKMNMVLYLSAEQAATVTVTIDSSAKLGFPNGWKRVYTIPANTVISTENLPKGSTNSAESGSDPNFDARLFDNPPPLGSGGEGVWRKKGIRIVSDVPIVAYAHIYGGTASGATMLLPIETWGYSYTSINSAQNNASNTFSWMYVIAKDDHTRIRITPVAASRRGRPANVPFTIDLMKGQIYQYVAESDCNTGVGPELTGTKIKSIVGADGACHPIAVFSGSGRTGGEPLACGPGNRDNDMQQGFPEHAWGKRYLTAPFSKATSGTNLQPSSFQTSAYKIITKEPGTTVKKNGVTISFTGNVYRYASNEADYIEADKPIMVAQYMGTGSCIGGLGDPEMVYISPIEQAIKNIGFYRNKKQSIDVNYLTLIVPTNGLSSLRIDNSQLFSHTYPHPKLTGHTVVVKGWASEETQCIVKCDSAFTAITYGMGSAESYGYNAGTFLKNLNAVSEINNVPDTSNTVQSFTCTGTPMTISAVLPYAPTSMNWKLSALGSVVTPNADVLVTNPVPVSSFVVGTATYYRYRLPGTYMFNTAGSYDLPIVNTSTDIDNCSLQETVEIKLEVKQRPSSDFTFTHSGCRTDSVSFSGPSSTGSYSAVGWNWNFGDTTFSTIRNPRKVYDSTGSYEVSLVVTSLEGCLSDTTRKPVVIAPARKASIFASVPNGCEGVSITLTDTTTVTNGTFYWNFGTGAPVTLTSNTPQTVTYPSPGTYTVLHTLQPAGNCVSDTVRKVIEVFANPVKPIVTSPVNYCQDATATPLNATALAGNTLTWYTTPALTGGSSTAPTPSTATAGATTYYVTQTSDKGCRSAAETITVTVTPAISNNTIAADQTLCSGASVAALTGTQPAGGNGAYIYQWERSIDGGVSWINILGATNPSFDPSGFISLSPGPAKFRRLVSSGLCNHVSNVVTITVETGLSNFDIAASQTICEGTSPALLVGQLPTGGTGTYTYQWEQSTNNIAWSPIPGATAKDYQPGVLNVATYFRRITSGGNCPAISSSVLITLNPTANGAISTTTAAICDYQTGSVVFTPSAGTAPYSIQLLITGPGGATSIVNQNGLANGPSTIQVLPLNSAPGTYTIQLQSVSDNTNCARTNGLNSLTITVTAKPSLGVSPAVEICKGSSTTLTATGAAIYTWSPSTGLSATTGSTVTANPITTTTYTVTGSTNGCTDSKTITVTVNELPAKPTVTTPVTYCQNAAAAPLSATAAAGNSLTWYTNSALTGGTTLAPTPSTTTAGSTIFYVTQTNANNCRSEAETIIVVVQPAISSNTISTDQTVCFGTPVNAITGSAPSGGNGAYTYQWQQSTDGGATWNAIAVATTDSYTPSSSSIGQVRYRRLVNSGLCNSLSNIVTITVEAALNTFEIGSSQSICEGTTPALLVGQTPTGGTGTYSYQWQSSTNGANWTAIPGATQRDYQPGTLTATTYYRRITNSGNCPATSGVVAITVSAGPAATISTTATAICDYQTGSIVFTPSAGTAPYTIQLLVTAPGGGTTTINQNNLGAGPSTVQVLPLNSASGAYTIQLQSVVDASGCSRTGLNTVQITVTAKPVVIVSPTTATVCQGVPVSLTASGASTYSWSPVAGLNVATGSTVTATPTSTTTYTVTGTTNGCEGSGTATITVVPLPAKPQVTSPVIYCEGATAIALTATPASGNTLTWYANAALTGGSATAPIPSTSSAGTFYYYVTQTNANSCVSDTSTITVTVYPNPVTAFNMPSNICMPGGIAAFENRSTIADGSVLSYLWNFGDGGTSVAKDPTHVYADSNSYNITLMVTSPYGCSGTLSNTLSSFIRRPTALFTVTPDTLCQGAESVFTDLSTPTGTITGWNWDYGDNSPVNLVATARHTYSSPGNYTVTLIVKNTAGCASLPATKDVLVYLQPVIDAGQSFVVSDGTTIQFNATANSTSGLSFSWSPTAGLSDATSLRPSLLVMANQQYTLTATGAGGCRAIDSLTVKLLRKINIPNAFSPNGDGINDKWEIPNLAEYPGAKVEVFNRWGQLVLQSNGYSRPWDGTFSGKPLPVATYYYVITLSNGFAPIAGSVTIVK